MFLFRGLYYRPGGSGQVRALINLKKREGKKKKVSKTKTKKLLIYGITICFSILSFIIFLSRTPHSLSAEATADLAVSQNSLYRGRRRGGGGAGRSIDRAVGFLVAPFDSTRRHTHTHTGKQVHRTGTRTSARRG